MNYSSCYVVEVVVAWAALSLASYTLHVLQMTCRSSPAVCSQRFIHISISWQVAFGRVFKTSPGIQCLDEKHCGAGGACLLASSQTGWWNATFIANQYRHRWTCIMLDFYFSLLSYFDWCTCEHNLVRCGSRLLSSAMIEALRSIVELSHGWADSLHMVRTIWIDKINC